MSLAAGRPVSLVRIHIISASLSTGCLEYRTRSLVARGHNPLSFLSILALQLGPAGLCSLSIVCHILIAKGLLALR